MALDFEVEPEFQKHIDWVKAFVKDEIDPLGHFMSVGEDKNGKPLDEDALDKIREMVRSQAKPMLTTTVRPWSRRRVVGALARRLTAKLAGA